MKLNTIYNKILFLLIISAPIIFSSCEDVIFNSLFDKDTYSCGVNYAGHQKYILDIQGKWTESRFDGFTPAKYVNNAHFSPFVIFVHKPDVNIFKEGRKASNDLEKLAENGKTSITSLRDQRDDIACVFVGDGMGGGESQKIMVSVNNIYSSITVLSMIAPTSDWFVAKKIDLAHKDNALAGFPLFTLRNDFKSKESVDMKNYDAGTEQDINSFSLDNASEPSQLDITRISTPFSTSDVLVKIKYYRFP